MARLYARGGLGRALFGRTVLVTGATGMLASYLVYYLLWLNERQRAGIRILALVRSEAKATKRFGVYVKKEYFHILTQDVCAPLLLAEPIDYIIHAASLASPQYYGPNPVEVAAPNVLGTYYLLELARSKKVRGFLYFSTGDVYGKLTDGVGAFSEAQMGTMDPLAPHSCYGESKRMGETWVASFAREYGVPACAVRIAHTYGPTMDLAHDPRVFSSFMQCVVEGRDIVMYSDGSARRPFCYAADAVAAFLLLLTQGKPGEAYNLSNLQEYLSIAELAEMLVSLVPERHLKVIRQQRTGEYMENQLNRGNRPSAEKLIALGWQPAYSAREGFTQVLRYFAEAESNEG